jgi:hypothetical protein
MIIESSIPLESARFELFDMKGRKVMSTRLSSTYNKLSVRELNSGLYYYRITQGQNVDSGKLTIR